MDAQRLSADRALYKRLIISFFDLHEARDFLHELRSEKNPDAGGRRNVARHALMTAFVVAYGRPFSNNRPVELVRPDLPASFLKDLSTEQKRLHLRLLELRNQEFAHSDPERSNVQVGIGTGPGGVPFASPVSDEVRIGLNELELAQVEALLTGIISNLHDELLRLQRLVVNGTPF